MEIEPSAKQEVSIWASTVVGDGNVIAYNNIHINRGGFTSFSLNYHRSLISKYRLDFKLGVGLEYIRTNQSATFYNGLNDQYSSHEFSNNTFGILVSPSFAVPLYTREQNEFGLEVFPSANLLIGSKDKSSPIYADYNDLNSIEELGRFSLKDQQSVIPSLGVYLYNYVPISNTNSLKLFGGFRVVDYSVASIITFSDNSSREFPTREWMNSIVFGGAFRF